MNEVGPMFHDLGNREVGVPFMQSMLPALEGLHKLQEMCTHMPFFLSLVFDWQFSLLYMPHS